MINCLSLSILADFQPGADAIKNITPSLGIPYLGVYTPR